MCKHCKTDLQLLEGFFLLTEAKCNFTFYMLSMFLPLLPHPLFIWRIGKYRWLPIFSGKTSSYALVKTVIIGKNCPLALVKTLFCINIHGVRRWELGLWSWFVYMILGILCGEKFVNTCNAYSSSIINNPMMTQQMQRVGQAIGGAGGFHTCSQAQ